MERLGDHSFLVLRLRIVFQETINRNNDNTISGFEDMYNRKPCHYVDTGQQMASDLPRGAFPVHERVVP